MLYRKEALAHVGSPDDLDQLLHVTRPRNWLVLAAIGALLLAALGWSLVTSLDATVEAAGGIPIGNGKALLLVLPRDAEQLRPGMSATLSCPRITASAVALDGRVTQVGPALAPASLVIRTLGADAGNQQLVPVRVTLDARTRPASTLPGVVCASTVTVERRRIIQLIIP